MAALSQVAITFDLDWAPDWCIELCRDICASHSVPCTFFVTHPNSVTPELMSDPNFEVGIHPNFLPESTQGSSHEAVLDYCIDIVPDARSMRMHSLFQSSPLLSLVSIKYPQVETDVSLFLPFHDNLQPVMKYEQDRSMTRLPYYWEDDNAAVDPTWRWDSPPPPSNGLKIFDFHPVLVALNIDDLKPYQQLKLKLGRRPLHDAAPEDVIGVANRGTGVADFIKNLLGHFDKADYSLISDISTKHPGCFAK